MDASFAKLMSRVYELEGLLLVAEKRDNEVTQDLLELIQAKAGKVNEIARSLTLPSQADEAINALHASAQEATPSNQHLPIEDYDPEETRQHDNGEEYEEVFETGVTQVEPMSANGKSEQQPLTQPPLQVADLQHQASDNCADDEERDEMSKELFAEVENIDGTLRVDEKLQRDMSKDMRRALSLNDRYRFRRELFGNSDYELNDALNMIESMRSLDEADDYFYNELGWDKDNEEVIDFMDIVRRHFL